MCRNMQGDNEMKVTVVQPSYYMGENPDEKIAEYIEICKVLCRYGYLEAVDRKGI